MLPDDSMCTASRFTTAQLTQPAGVVVMTVAMDLARFIELAVCCWILPM
jgi:hypothetical protein